MTRELLTLLEPFPSPVVDAMKVISAVGLGQLDACVVRYMARALEGQMTAESRVEDDTIVAALAAHFAAFAVCADVEAGRRLAEAVVAKFNVACPPPPADEAVALEAPVTIGKAYDDSLRQAARTRAPRKLVIHANEQWTWASFKAANKEQIRQQRDDERRQALQSAYDEFLKKRGISAQRQVMKLHVNEGAYSYDIRCRNVHIAMGKKVLLDNVDFVLHAGHRYGLVGRNGCGKTTLLRALAERELEGISPFVQIVHVEQEITGNNETPLETVLAADVERAKLIEAERMLLKEGGENADQKLAEVYTRMDAIDAHSAEARASAILSGLSFTKDLLVLPTSRLSGGWRMRVALARALFAEPDILLLDEPTNHLDLHAVLWLEAYLREWHKTLVVVSHSRSFLNNVCAEMIHLHDGTLTYYNGNYDQFELSRCEALKQQQRHHDAQEKQRAHMQAFVDKFRYSAARAAMAQSRLKALERMERVAPVMADAAVSFDFPEAESLSGPLIQVIDGAFGYKGDNLFTNVNVTIDSASRTVLVGANGAGKSTFLSLCLGHLEPRQGQVVRNPRTRVGHFTQHHLDMLTPQMTALEFLASKYPNVPAQQLRSTMGSFGLSGDIAMQPIYTMSGGQKSRLALAWVCMQNPHLLVLDEPTNHLDIDTVSALLKALMEFKGGVLVVSHDEHLITTLCDELLVCAGGAIVRFDGDFEAYKKSISLRRS